MRDAPKRLFGRLCDRPLQKLTRTYKGKQQNQLAGDSLCTTEVAPILLSILSLKVFVFPRLFASENQ